jgi:aspartate aminotransferase
LPEQTIICGGISKEVSGTGVRIGFLIAPEYITKALIKLQGNFSSCVCLSTMRGYAHFLEQDRDMHIRKAILQRLNTKREIMLKGFQEHQGLKDCVWIPPKGTDEIVLKFYWR